MNETSVEFSWIERAAVLEPSVAYAMGSAAEQLARHLAKHLPHGPNRVRAVASRGLFCVIGPADALPWIDGIAYLGLDARAPQLRIPTSLEPSISPQLLERALLERARAVGGEAPLAVVHDPPRIFSLAGGRGLTTTGIETWLAEQ